MIKSKRGKRNNLYMCTYKILCNIKIKYSINIIAVPEANIEN